MIVALNIMAGERDGEPIFEEVQAEQIAANRFVLTRSPGLASGLAAGDEFELTDDEPQGYRVLNRGRNVCVQIFFPHDPDRCRRSLAPLAERIGGRLDGSVSLGTSGEIVFTFPVSVGFPAIEHVMAQAKVLSPDCEWYYGNVYDSKDGVTPLNWWL